MMNEVKKNEIRCHYEVLGLETTAESVEIKKAHRKLALRYHPDKNPDDPNAQEQFRRVQEAYETLSDPMERKWYDEHRDAILRGWSSGGGGDGDDDDGVDMLFDVAPYMFAGCYHGFSDDDPNSFYNVYAKVFESIHDCEKRFSKESDAMNYSLPLNFGNSTTPWEMLATFYQSWESFSSQLNFAWVDPFNVVKDAPSRRVRRAMDEENRKARRAAKKAYVDDVLALIRFVKRRDPRVQAKRKQMEEEKAAKERQMKEESMKKKKEMVEAREQWRREAECAMADAEEQDRLAGRIRLADLEDEEDYDYGGGKKKKGKKKKVKKKKGKANTVSDVEENDALEEERDAAEQDQPENQTVVAEVASDNADAEEEVHSELNVNVIDDKVRNLDVHNNQDNGKDDEQVDEEEEDEEIDVWRCEICKKDFKSKGQFENHMRSKKHKEALKKHNAMIARLEKEVMEEMIDEIEVRD